MVICLERGADLHMAQLIPLPLTVSCFSKIQIGFMFLVLAHLVNSGGKTIYMLTKLLHYSPLSGHFSGHFIGSPGECR